MDARPARHGPLTRFRPRAASKLALFAATLLYLALLSLAIRAAQPSAVSLTGTWRGTGSDFWEKTQATDGMNVTWVLTQTGSEVSGTVATTALPGDVACSSCHRAKGGTVSGTISGTALTLTMNFPGQAGEITPNCSVSFNGTAATIALPTFTTAYTLNDSCEGPFTNGLLTMTRDSFTDDPLSPGVSVVRAMHIVELRSRIDAVRARLKMSPYAYADPLTAGVTSIRAQHLLDLRTALTEAYLAAGRKPPDYTDTDLVGSLIRGSHIAELRAALALIE